ncbi:hypothetical protein [Archangium gephyra]
MQKRSGPLDWVEETLGRTLFDRRADGYAPTFEGESVLEALVFQRRGT